MFPGLFLVVIQPTKVQRGKKPIDPTGHQVIGCPMPK
jgi:hypothetical protein